MGGCRIPPCLTKAGACSAFGPAAAGKRSLFWGVFRLCLRRTRRFSTLRGPRPAFRRPGREGRAGGIHFRREQGPSRAGPAHCTACPELTGLCATRAKERSQAEFTSAVSKARVMHVLCTVQRAWSRRALASPGRWCRLPGLRRMALYQRTGVPGRPSGGRAARAAQAEFTSAVSKARVVQASHPVQCVQSRRAFVPPGRRKGHRRNSLPP